MKKVVLLGSRNSAGKNDVSIIQSALSGYDGKYSASVVYFEDLLFSISKDSRSVTDIESQKDLAEADLVVAMNWYRSGDYSIYRDVAFTAALYLSARGVEFWNQEILLQRSTTKLSAMMQLALAGFDIPASRFSLNTKALMSLDIDFPLILKDVAASRGRNNYLVKNKAELEARLSGSDLPNRLILQEYIENDGDLRIICLDARPKLVISRRRQSPDTHLNNTSQGARADIVPTEELDEEINQACQEICRLMGRNIAGIDLLVENKGLSRKVFLEVNAIPQLTSGSFVEEKLQALAESVTKHLER